MKPGDEIIVRNMTSSHYGWQGTIISIRHGVLKVLLNGLPEGFEIFLSEEEVEPLIKAKIKLL